MRRLPRIREPSDGTHPVNTIALPFPDGIAAPPGRSLGIQDATVSHPSRAVDYRGLSEKPSRCYVQQWNLNIQRALPAEFFLSAVYVGSKGTHLEQYSQQVNQISDALLAQAAAQVDLTLPKSQGERRPCPINTKSVFINGQALALTGSTTTKGSSFVLIPSTRACNLPAKGPTTVSITLSAHRAKTIRGPGRC